MKLGYVGYGKSTNRYHMPFVDASGVFDVVGFYTKGDTVFDMPYPAYQKNIIRFDTFEQLLDSQVDVVVVTTPAPFHYEYAKQALLAGKHVIVEKPLCDTLAQARELYQIANEKNLKLTPYQNRRYDSDFLTIKKILRRVDIGKVMEIESNHTHYRPDGADRTGNKYDGSVYGHAVHFIDQIVSLYGEPDNIIADITNQKNYYIGEGRTYGENIPEDYYDIKMIYGNLRIRVRHSQLIVKEPPRWIINATEATVEKYKIDQQERDLKKGVFLNSPDFGKDTEDCQCTIYFKKGIEKIAPEYQHYTRFYLDFKKWVEGRGDAPVTEKQALSVINILESIVNHKKYIPCFS